MEISDIAKTPFARISRKMMTSSVPMASLYEFYRSRPKSRPVGRHSPNPGLNGAYNRL